MEPVAGVSRLDHRLDCPPFTLVNILRVFVAVEGFVVVLGCLLIRFSFLPDCAWGSSKAVALRCGLVGQREEEGADCIPADTNGSCICKLKAVRNDKKPE